ncbi:hypothetical protein NE235_13620 [Actinoallomurus spadix]|uniref:Uncharacterized protein n=1 Tax=Actinoallomurus spadix TaxID=79912 RepID=A0ABN0WDG9_9ACTN|nr:hypothetical protein [Actinoallomurus spadix]MCO5987139.1 hypothetical protein [Actinoallomurus spadix]
MIDVVFDEVSVLWAEHLGLTFPDDLKWLEADGESVVLLDGDMAGCVRSYLDGTLDGEKRAILDDCSRVLRELLPKLRCGEGRRYAARLVRMADLILSDSPLPQSSET